MPWDLRPTGIPVPEVDVEAQPGAAEEERRERRWQISRERAEHPDEECERKEQTLTDAAETESSAKRTRGGDTRAREFYVVREDVNKFGPTPRCPGCADVSRGVSVKHAHNDVSQPNREVVDGRRCTAS